MTEESEQSARSRLALYDAVVGSSLAWRATTTPPVVYPTDDERAAAVWDMNFARRTVQRHGKHVVDEGVVRQLAAIHARAPKPALSPESS